jgi:hypothetical protein
MCLINFIQLLAADVNKTKPNRSSETETIKTRCHIQVLNFWNSFYFHFSL